MSFVEVFFGLLQLLVLDVELSVSGGLLGLVSFDDWEGNAECVQYV